MTIAGQRLRAQDVVELLRRYEIHPPTSDERYLAHAKTDRGVRLWLRVEPAFDGMRISLGHESARVWRLLPLSHFEAQEMVAQLASDAAVPLTENARGLLAHLLERAGRLSETASLMTLVFDPLFVRENDYTIVGVGMWADRRLRLRRRLAPDAHDRGAVFAYRPTARGRGSIR